MIISRIPLFYIVGREGNHRNINVRSVTIALFWHKIDACDNHEITFIASRNKFHLA